MSMLVTGQQVGSFVLDNQIGSTNMGEVWRAWDSANQPVALKTIAMEIRHDETFVARFRQEAEEQRRLRHRSIVPIYDFFAEDDGLFLVMPFIPGGSLEDLLSREGRLSVKQALDISVQILAALDYAHQNMVIHRDVKPSNILLDQERAYLTDFGVALPIGKTRLTKVARVMGTPGYMSPEQIVNPLDVNHLTDVYSFGCVLYEMLAGRPPFVWDGQGSGDPLYGVQTQQVNSDAPPIREFNPDVPARLERIIATALSRSREERFPGCGSFGRALESIREGLAGPVAVEVTAAADVAVQPETKPEAKIAAMPVKRVSAAGNVMGMLAAVLLPVSWLGPRFFPHTFGYFWFWETYPHYVLNNFHWGYLLAAVVHFRILYKAWAAIQDGKPRSKPGKAVGLLLVPVYSVYWGSQAYPGFAKDYNRMIQSGGLACPRQPVWLYWAFYLANYLAVPAASIAAGRQGAAIILLEFVVLMPVMTATLCLAINRLAAATAGIGTQTKKAEGEVLA
jgi:serine/threonine-protein kinase